MRLLNALTTIITIMVVLIALSLVSARFIGAGSYVVQSGSMEPFYHTGALIFDKKVDVQQLEAGDVITFSIAEDMTATHRIVEVLADGDAGNAGGEGSVLRFRTKGDANEDADAEPVDARNVIGTLYGDAESLANTGDH